MPEIIDLWFQSGTAARIESLALRPIENPFLRKTALAVARGQAHVFFMQNGTRWILKKFLPSRKPDRSYIEAIGSILPSGHLGFESATQRKVLHRKSLAKSGYYSDQLAEWLDETVLMPCVSGLDWAGLADKVRDGKIRLTRQQRLLMCKNLSAQIATLERGTIAHRDLSSTNIMIDLHTWDVHLIDWDSLYHPKLQIPNNTTYGTSGYISPIVKTGGIEDPRTTWCSNSDRFSLAVLILEFLAATANSVFTGDGGMFEQVELYQRRGRGLSQILGSVQREFPEAVNLFNQALQARKFEGCPSPNNWLSICGSGSEFEAPSLSEVYDPISDLAAFVNKWKPEVPHPAVSLKDLDPITWETSSNSSPPTELPPSLSDMPEPKW